MEFNKIFGAILVAGITAMLAGFIARNVIHVEDPEVNAFKIAVAEAAEGGAAAAEPVAEPILAMLATADVAKGQSTAKVCGACHTFNKGEPARVGPNLYGIINNKHAHMEGFAYSDAMKALHDKEWTYSELNHFLWNPKKHINGTKMVFAGIKKPEDRANVIAYLRTLADSPAALPTEADIAAEAPKAEEPKAEEGKEGEAKEEGKAEGDAAAAEAPKAEEGKDEAKADAKAGDAPAVEEAKPEAKKE
ncbi:MAG: cytochrome c family protein [Alphaproteobacteria bacterium]|nr:cytochrome c family protein [Alphaproteobacteria bacterium]